MKKYRITTPDGRLNARVYGDIHTPSPKPAYLFFSGWSPSTYSWSPNDLVAGRVARRHECICVTAYFRGMGSPGNIKVLTRADFMRDAICTYDFVSDLAFVDSADISVVGESFGSYTACLLSAHRSIKSLILRVPTDFPSEGFDSVPQYTFTANKTLDWKKARHDYSESPALAAIHDFKGRLSIISSENDEFVPYQTTQNYLNAARQDTLHHYVMKATGHSLINPFKLFRYMCIVDGIVQYRPA